MRPETWRPTSPTRAVISPASRSRSAVHCPACSGVSSPAPATRAAHACRVRVSSSKSPCTRTAVSDRVAPRSAATFASSPADASSRVEADRKSGGSRAACRSTPYTAAPSLVNDVPTVAAARSPCVRVVAKP